MVRALCFVAVSQRDFSVYVVNCFDVAVAQRVLFPLREVSLPSLVLLFVDKQITPKPEEEWIKR